MLQPELHVKITGLEPVVSKTFSKWSKFLKEKINFSKPDSSLHSYAHEERVLLYALILAEAIYPSDDDVQEILAHAAVFHDTRRKNDSYDVGHGARGAVHYKNFCLKNGLKYYPEAAALMRYHDLDDTIGKAQIKKRFIDNYQYVENLYSIFKDADALDRWRLGPNGLDISFLRTKEAKKLADFSKRLVKMSLV